MIGHKNFTGRLFVIAAIAVSLSNKYACAATPISTSVAITNVSVVPVALL